jgi:WhiB family redox-sensing transcriptional regulator
MSEWRERAACIGAPHEVFFPIERKFTTRTWAKARAICATCEVREQCLAVALSVDVSEDRWGMFGGMTPSERRYHRRKAGRQA